MSSTIQATGINGEYYDAQVSELSWRPTAYGVLIEGGKVLLLPTKFGYALPGGGMEIDESIEGAVVREVKEETGYDVRVKGLIDVRDQIFVWKPDDATERGVFHTIVMYYACEKVGGKLSREGFTDEEKGFAELAEWVSIDVLADIKLASSIDYRPIIEKALSYRGK